MSNKTHYVFRVSKDPCDDSAQYYAGDGQWTSFKSGALLMTEQQAASCFEEHHSESMVAGYATDTDDHHLL
jgi:hypothetical protein